MQGFRGVVRLGCVYQSTSSEADFHQRCENEFRIDLFEKSIVGLQENSTAGNNCCGGDFLCCCHKVMKNNILGRSVAVAVSSKISLFSEHLTAVNCLNFDCLDCQWETRS